MGFPFLFSYWLRCFLSSGLQGTKASHFHIQIAIGKPGFRAIPVRASNFLFLRGHRALSPLGQGELRALLACTLSRGQKLGRKTNVVNENIWF